MDWYRGQFEASLREGESLGDLCYYDSEGEVSKLGEGPGTYPSLKGMHIEKYGDGHTRLSFPDNWVLVEIPCSLVWQHSMNHETISSEIEVLAEGIAFLVPAEDLPEIEPNLSKIVINSYKKIFDLLT